MSTKRFRILRVNGEAKESVVSEEAQGSSRYGHGVWSATVFRDANGDGVWKQACD